MRVTAGAVAQTQTTKAGMSLLVVVDPVWNPPKVISEASSGVIYLHRLDIHSPSVPTFPNFRMVGATTDWALFIHTAEKSAIAHTAQYVSSFPGLWGDALNAAVVAGAGMMDASSYLPRGDFSLR